MLFYLVQTNFIDFTIVVFLIIFLFTNRAMSKEINRVFLFVALVINILILADSTDFYLAQGKVPHTLRYVTSATGYAFRPVPIMLFACILIREEKKTHYFLVPLAIVNSILAIPAFLQNGCSILTRRINFTEVQSVYFRLLSVPSIYCACSSGQ